MSEFPDPRHRTRQLIALADEVANRPLPMYSRKLIPLLLAALGVAAIWFGLRGDDPAPVPSPSTTTPEVVPSVVFTAPP